MKRAEPEHDYSHCKTHGKEGGLMWCAKCPVCRPKSKPRDRSKDYEPAQ